MNRISRNVSIILRTEKLIAQRNLTVMTKRIGLIATAVVIAAIGVVMLNYAAYLALASIYSAPMAALIVALVNMVVAIAVLVYANTIKPGADTAQVVELRDMAMEDIEAELQEGLSEAKAAVDDVRRMAQDPFGAAAPKLAGVLANALIKYMKS